MKLFLTLLAITISFFSLADEKSNFLLAVMLSKLPQEKVTIEGELIMRKQRGIPVKEVAYKMEVDFHGNPSSACYTLFDSFHRPIEDFSVQRDKAGNLTLSSHDANGNLRATPKITDRVAETDLTWLDISLSFLWWNNTKYEGEGEFRGDTCDIILAYPPAPLDGCSAVRLYIDRKYGFMRQAQQLNEKGDIVRSMWVASVGKINDKWMIRDMEVKRPKTGLMTKLRVLTMETP